MALLLRPLVRSQCTTYSPSHGRGQWFVAISVVLALFSTWMAPPSSASARPLLDCLAITDSGKLDDTTYQIVLEVTPSCQETASPFQKINWLFNDGTSPASDTNRARGWESASYPLWYGVKQAKLWASITGIPRGTYRPTLTLRVDDYSRHGWVQH